MKSRFFTLLITVFTLAMTVSTIIAQEEGAATDNSGVGTLLLLGGIGAILLIGGVMFSRDANDDDS